MSVKKAKNHHYRQEIKENGYLDYVEIVSISDRNKKIVLEYMSGESYENLAIQYGLSYNRIPQIIYSYINKVSRYIKKNG